MILKLRNKRVIIEENTVPDRVNDIQIKYDYELGTNHYKTVLTLNETQFYVGYNPIVSLDTDKSTVIFKVDLYDTHNKLVREYTGTYNYCKLCLVGTSKLMDVYKELKRLSKENKELKEKGEVI